MKKTSGFTLVELIVVIAILAILAGIAIPVYSGYIKKAQEAADLQVLDSVRTASVFAAMSANPDNVVAKIEVTDNKPSPVKIYVKGVDDAGDPTEVALADSTDISEYVGSDSLNYIESATWTNKDGWTDIEKKG